MTRAQEPERGGHGPVPTALQTRRIYYPSTWTTAQPLDDDQRQLVRGSAYRDWVAFSAASRSYGFTAVP
jgi:hypothetical protein